MRRPVGTKKQRRPPVAGRKARVPSAARVPRPASSAPAEGALMRIHAVAEQTGVPEPTLRAWERRYGIPTPERTAAGYRLYGAQHLDQVRRMRALCDAGVAAAEAAQLVRGAAAPAAPLAAGEDLHDRSLRVLLGAVERFDEVGLAEETRRMLVLGDSITLLDRVIRPLMIEVGERWHRGALSVAHEHLASHMMRGVLSDLVRLTPTSPSAPRALLACFEDEDHDLGLLGVALRLAAWGIRPVILGARTPPGAVRNALAASGAALVALSVSVAPPPPRARALLEDYAAACGTTPWMVGGAGVGPLAERVAALGGSVQPSDPAALQTLTLRLVRRR